MDSETLSQVQVSDRLESLVTKFKKLYGRKIGQIRAFPVSCFAEENMSELRRYLEVLICQQKQMAMIIKYSFILLEEVLMEHKVSYARNFLFKSHSA